MSQSDSSPSWSSSLSPLSYPVSIPSDAADAIGLTSLKMGLCRSHAFTRLFLDSISVSSSLFSRKTLVADLLEKVTL